jgi:hypothetical protein
MRRAALLSGLAVLLVGLAALAPRYLTREREFVAVTPQARSVVIPTTIPLPADGRACMDLVALDAHSEQARLWPTTPGRRAVPLEITLSGEGYSAHGRAAADYRDGDTVKIPVDPPPRSVQATACVHNLGRAPADLAAVHDRGRSRSAVRVNGTPVAPGFALEFYERRPTTILDRLPDSMRRMSVLRPGVVAPGVLWGLLIVFLVGVPVAALKAFTRAAGDDERRETALRDGA